MLDKPPKAIMISVKRKEVPREFSGHNLKLNSRLVKKTSFVLMAIRTVAAAKTQIPATGTGKTIIASRAQ